ncbi:MAG: hypothetical protein JNL32_05705 [Candidatus Kapabacteria bacterium]|nr:hypothetical protein [Candidatus Kapabacteria bacterium]
MFESDIERSKIILLERLISPKPFVYLRDIINNQSIEYAYKQYFDAEFSWWLYEEQMLRHANPHLDLGDPAIQSILGDLDAQYRRTARFNREQITAITDAAVKSILNYRIRPRTTLKWFVFRGEPTKPVHEVLLRMRHFADYAYLHNGIEQWLHERGLNAESMEILPVIEFEKLVKRLDDDTILELSPSQFVSLINPIFLHFADATKDVQQQVVPIEAIIVFLDDKEIHIIAQKLERMLYQQSIRYINRDMFLNVVDEVLNEVEVQEAATAALMSESSQTESTLSADSIATVVAPASAVANDIPPEPVLIDTHIESDSMHSTDVTTDDVAGTDEIADEDDNAEFSIADTPTDDHDTAVTEEAATEDIEVDDAVHSSATTDMDEHDEPAPVDFISQLDDESLSDTEIDSTTEVEQVATPGEADTADILDKVQDTLDQPDNVHDTAKDIPNDTPSNYPNDNPNGNTQLLLDMLGMYSPHTNTYVVNGTSPAFAEIVGLNFDSITNRARTQPHVKTSSFGDAALSLAEELVAEQERESSDTVTTEERSPDGGFERISQSDISSAFTHVETDNIPPLADDTVLPQILDSDNTDTIPEEEVEVTPDNDGDNNTIDVADEITSVEPVFIAEHDDIRREPTAPETVTTNEPHTEEASTESSGEILGIISRVLGTTNGELDTDIADDSDSDEDGQDDDKPVFVSGLGRGLSSILTSAAHEVIATPPPTRPSIATFIDAKQRATYIRKLCNKDELRFDGLITKLDRSTKWKEALAHLDQFYAEQNIDPQSATAGEFRMAVYRRFVNPA